MQSNSSLLTKTGFLTLCILTFTCVTLLASSSPENTCCNILRLIDNAVQQWALESEKSETNAYSLTDTNITKNIRGGIPPCPSGGQYSPGKTVANEPECSIHGSASNIIPEGKKQDRREKIRNIILAIVCIACVAGSIRLIFWALHKQSLKNKP